MGKVYIGVVGVGGHKLWGWWVVWIRVGGMVWWGCSDLWVEEDWRQTVGRLRAGHARPLQGRVEG